MSESILKALMQLFAIIGGKSGEVGKETVRLFLKSQLNSSLKTRYIAVYDEFTEKFYGGAELTQKKRSMASVKVLRMCEEINEELNQKDKILVCLRLVEFVSQYEYAEIQEWEFVQTVADVFNIQPELYSSLLLLARLEHPSDVEHWRPAHLCRVAAKDADIVAHDLKGELYFFWIESENLFLLKYLGDDELYVNTQRLERHRVFAFPQGSAVRGAKIHPIYYSDILHRLLKRSPHEWIEFQAGNIQYKFPNGKIALHSLSIDEQGGRLVGIMGGSGSGKSTLLNVLNGNYRPTQGHVLLNGIDIYAHKKYARQWMGYVAQDDILFEELTVGENLLYSAKLEYPEFSHNSLQERVDEVLRSVGLLECKDLRVGSVLDKTISGGQRKRLNIALELIRSSKVLFVDEPTSGLSSRDSEMIMDLLKELTLRGKLIFVVIHQPSSDIFKMFDRLFLLDQGGYPIYYGNPIESLLYFKEKAHFADITESQCPHCGNVNPEQLFNIIEAKLVDQYGEPTEIRRMAPKEWNEFFIQDHFSIDPANAKIPNASPRPSYAIAKTLIYLLRDVKTKVVNRQYMLINFLEAPLLAVLLSLFVKYFPVGEKGLGDYIFRENENYPQYLFFAVVVALFLGLTVSAEEILKDKKILKRERYLGHSYASYLSSKLAVLYFISLIQTASFVAVGNYILEVNGMFLPFWLVLFSVSCFANTLGLNISAAFKTAKVIYILIPIMIIPQLLFSGVIVRFDKLFPSITQQEKVPWIGEVMASRWAFEAMAVYQFTSNDFADESFARDVQQKSVSWRKDYWTKEMKSVLSSMKDDFKRTGKVGVDDWELINAELHEVSEEYGLEDRQILRQEDVDVQTLEQTEIWIQRLESYFIRYYNDLYAQSQMSLQPKLSDETQRLAYVKLKNDHLNESIEDILTRKNDLKKIVRYDNRLVQKSNLVYRMPRYSGLFGAHFYSPFKRIGGYMFPTFWMNVLVIWGMTIMAGIALYVDLPKWLNVIWEKRKRAA
jgi:ABC-type multidrug transport system ATPase subunit